jgi:hypothetical protein
MRVSFFAMLLTHSVACGKLSGDPGAAKSAAATSAHAPTDTGDKFSALPPADGEDAACEVAPSQAGVEPSRMAMTCTWKSDCADGGVVALGANVDPATIKVTGQADAKEYAATYTRASGELQFAQWACPAMSSTFVVQFQEVATEGGGDAAAATLADFDLTLYAHPCGNSAPLQRTCAAGVPMVDVAGEVVTCASLGLELGDTCPAGLERCERSAAQACEGAPTTVIDSATYLFCLSEPFGDDTACPELARAVKRDID